MDLLKKYRRYLIPAGFLVAGALIGLALTYLPAPVITEAPKATKDAAVTIAGKTGAKIGVVLMNQDRHILLAANADERGEFRFTGVPVGEGQTVLKLRAVNGGWRASRPVTLTIGRDTTAPSLSVNDATGGTVTGANYLVSGKAEPGSTVTVNGVQATVGSDGSWSATVALQPGKNTLTVTATDPAGNQTTTAQTVTYTPSAAGSAAGTATTAAETTTYSAGSQPPPPTGTTTNTNTNTSAGTNTNTSVSGATTNTNAGGQTVGSQPSPQPTSLVVTASLNNLSPNARSNQQIFAKVTTNLGAPATAAVVTAVAHYKTGDVTYALANAGNGTYVTSFKLGENAVSNFTVFIDVTAAQNSLSGSGRTSFTPR